MRLKQIDLYLLQIPFWLPIKHHLANHTSSDNLVVKVTTDAGVAGYGEGVARRYVTGETTDTSLDFLLDNLIPQINGFQAANLLDLENALAVLLSPESITVSPAACCALELAILDAAGKTWGQTLAYLLGGAVQPLIYSAVVPMMPHSSFQSVLSLIREKEMYFVKIKVGNDKDLQLLAQARQTLGEAVNIRVDANGAWSVEEAEERIRSMMAYRISAVEQPVPKEDIPGLKRLAECAPVPIIADESLCGEQDAEHLASLGACQVFNLRLSKCGGIFAAARLYEIGRQRGIASQLGCQVGETGILAAAGRQLASSREMLYLEGSYSNYLLEEDIVNEPVDFGPGGVAQVFEDPGLGVTINEKALHRLAIGHKLIRM